MRFFCIFSLFTLLYFSHSALAQQNSTELVAAAAVQIKPAGGHAVLKKLPVRAVLVLDSRFDTSKIGYIKRGGHFKKLTTDTPLRQAAYNYLQLQYSSAYTTTSPYTLVLVVKHFWLQETSEAEQLHRKIERSSAATETFSSCTATLEAYLANGAAYIPLFKRDSIYVDGRSLKTSAENLLAQPFDDCLQKLAGMDLSKITSAKRTLTWAEIETFNQRRYQHPHFTTALNEKGIYKTFTDFLQNKLTKQEFVIEYGQHTDEVFTPTNGKPEALSDFWGLCDGKTLFLKVGYNVFELAPQGNTYDLWGAKLSVHKYSHYTPAAPGSVRQALVGSSLFNKNRVVTNAKPLQLNMETGTVY